MYCKKSGAGWIIWGGGVGCKERKSGYIFTESLSIIPTGKVEVAVQMEVVGRELGHSHDGLLAVVSDLVNLVLLLCFLY